MIWKLIFEIFTDTAFHNNVNNKRNPLPLHISLVNNHISTPHSASRKKFQSIESIFSTQTPNSIQSIERNLPLPLPLPLAPFYLNTPEKPPLHAKILIKVRRP